jgi:large subunit ribosomal protein L23
MRSVQKGSLSIIKYPILTEKTVQLIEQNRYSFAVDAKADKYAIKESIEQLFGVTSISVNTSLLPFKRRCMGTTVGRNVRYKRAVVKLAPEDSIGVFDGE